MRWAAAGQRPLFFCRLVSVSLCGHKAEPKMRALKPVAKNTPALLVEHAMIFRNILSSFKLGGLLFRYVVRLGLDAFMSREFASGEAAWLCTLLPTDLARPPAEFEGKDGTRTPAHRWVLGQRATCLRQQREARSKIPWVDRSSHFPVEYCNSHIH